MFASKGILEHLARGVVGLGLFVLAGLLGASHPWLSLAVVPLGFVALRGCPTCWTIGLVQTVMAKVQGNPSGAACTDGTCAPSRGLSPSRRPP